MKEEGHSPEYVRQQFYDDILRSGLASARPAVNMSTPKPM